MRARHAISIATLSTICALSLTPACAPASALPPPAIVTVPCSAATLVQDLLEVYENPDSTQTLSLAAGCTYAIPSPAATGNPGGAYYGTNGTPFDWYGPSGLPAIDGNITIEGNGATIEGGGASSRYRLIFVAPDPTGPNTPGFTSPGAGVLTLTDLTLTGGDAQGGTSAGGGGGAGMGGAIFNAGTLTLNGVTVTGARAQGGTGPFTGLVNGSGMSALGGGGIGSDPTLTIAGGFGPGSFGGAGGGAAVTSGGPGEGGGGGGFADGDTGGVGATGHAGAGGGPNTGFGGAGDLAPGGDGSGGGGSARSPSAGAAFGEGTTGKGGAGGGVGGGGNAGAGGGFGAGGGTNGSGGFGGGGGGSNGAGSGSPGGFGGGVGGNEETGTLEGEPDGGGGAGMGGAIFNLFGSVTLVNSTLAGNSAGGGATVMFSRATAGSGFGGAVFNLDGTVSATNVTVSGNTAPQGGTGIYSLGYYSNAGTTGALGVAPTATVTVTDSIIANATGATGSTGATGPALVSSAPSTTVAGANGSQAIVVAFGGDLISSQSATIGGDGNVLASLPELQPLGTHDGSTIATEPPQAGSPVIAFGTCVETDDELGRARPPGFCTLGAVEAETPPVITITTPADGAQYLQGQSITAHYACVDGPGLGLQSGASGCQAPVANGAPVDTSAPGLQSFAVTANSQDGFVSQAATDFTVVGVPSTAIDEPADGAVYGQDQTVTASYSCSEGAFGPGLLPGTTGCQGPIPDGAAVDTSGFGPHTFAVIARSTDGLSTSASAHFTVAAPPTVSITAPADGSTFVQGTPVLAAYTCTEGPDGPGLRIGLLGCSAPVASGVQIDTDAVGEHGFLVAATSGDGLRATQTVHYTVIPAPAPSGPSGVTGVTGATGVTGVPVNTARPLITGTLKRGSTLTCTPGAWTENPTAFTTRWSRNGTPIIGATTATYTLRSLDEGSVIACTVAAATSVGTASAVPSPPVTIPVPPTRGCPAASGTVHGATLGHAELGMTQTALARAYSRSRVQILGSTDSVCLTPRGLRVGFASGRLLHAARGSAQPALRDRAVWIATTAPRYAIDGIRPGARLQAALAAFPQATLLHVKWSTWYFAQDGSVTAVIKTNGTAVQEVAIATPALTGTQARRAVLIASIG